MASVFFVTFCLTLSERSGTLNTTRHTDCKMKRLHTRHTKDIGHGIIVCRDYNMDELLELKQTPDGFLVAAERFAMHTPQQLFRRSDGEWLTIGRYFPVTKGHRLVAELEYIPQQ